MGIYTAYLCRKTNDCSILISNEKGALREVEMIIPFMYPKRLTCCQPLFSRQRHCFPGSQNYSTWQCLNLLCRVSFEQYQRFGKDAQLYWAQQKMNFDNCHDEGEFASFKKFKTFCLPLSEFSHWSALSRSPGLDSNARFYQFCVVQMALLAVVNPCTFPQAT